MSFVLVVSIAIRIAALCRALLVWRRLRDWRIGFLASMLLLMALRQSWTLKRQTRDWHVLTWGTPDELPGLLVSVLALLAVIFLEKMLVESRRKAEEERLFGAILRAALDDSSDFFHRVLVLLTGFPALPLQPRAAVWLREEQQGDYVRVASLGLDDVPFPSLPCCPLDRDDDGRGNAWKQETEENGVPVVQLCIRAEGACCGWLVLHLKPGARLQSRDDRLLEQVAILLGLSLVKQRARRQLQHQARHDALTGLANRYEFQERLTAALDGVRRGERHVLCYFDLDQFKVVNDTCGHAAGDALLRQVAALLRGRVEAGDCVARLGGDEFAWLFCRCDLDRAMTQVRQIRQYFERWRFPWKDRVFPVRAAFGLVVLEPAMGDWEAALRCADAACFMAKERGCNQIHVYRCDDLTLRQRDREMNWVSRIELALEKARFRLYAQPIVPLGESGETRPRYEILLRLHEADGEVISPGQFLPAAERYRLMVRIDRWVVARTLALLARFPDHESSYSINLSGQSLGDGELLALIERGSRQLVPGRLCFEITETAAIGDLPRARPFLARLRALGCRLALDDFGTGLSSYAYLRHLPVDEVKIDGQFVRDLCQDPLDLAMVRSINEVAHILGKRTVAEWVEDGAVLEKLRELGVDYAQGRHVGEPLPLERILRTRRKAL